MRKLGLLLLLVAGAAFAGIALDQSTTYTFSNCAVGGSVAQSVTAGDYVTSFAAEGVWLCIADSASTCASGGTFFNAGVTAVLTIGSAPGTKSVSCRSTGSTGNVYLTRRGN